MGVALLRTVSGHRCFSFGNAPHVEPSGLLPPRGVALGGTTAARRRCRLSNGDQRELDLSRDRNRRRRRGRIPAGHPAGDDAAQPGDVAPLGCRAPARRRRRAQRGCRAARAADLHGRVHAAARSSSARSTIPAVGVEDPAHRLRLRRHLRRRHGRLAGDPQRRPGHLRRHRRRLPGRDPDADEELDPSPRPRRCTPTSGAVISMVILLLTVDRLDLRRRGVPALHPVHGLRARSVLVGLEPGPRLRRARHRRRRPWPRAGLAGGGRERAATGRLVGNAGEVVAEGSRSVPTAHVNGIDIEYLTEGDPSDPPLLLVMGLGAQLIDLARGIRRRAAQARLLRDPLRQPRLRALDQVRRAARPRCPVRRRRTVVGPLPRSRTWPTTPPRCWRSSGIAQTHVVGRLDGRHDHPGPGDQPPGALPHGLLHHVDHRRPRRGRADRRGDDGPAAAGGDEPGGGDRGQRGGEPGHRLAGVPDRRAPCCASGPARRTTAPTAPRARPASLAPSSPHPTAPRGCTVCDMPFLVVHGEDDPLVTPSGGAGDGGRRARLEADHDPGHGARPARGAVGRRSPTPSWPTRSWPRV